MTTLRITFLFACSLVLLSTCQTREPKDSRYAQKQFFLGNDYFDKYMEALQKIERLQIENAKTEQEIATTLQQQPDEQALLEVRIKKQRIQKNQEVIGEEREMSGRFLNAALEELKKSLVADPAYSGTHFLLGLIYLKKATSELDISMRMQCMAGDSLAEHRDMANSLLTQARRHFIKAATDRQVASKCHNNVAAIDIHFGNHEDAVTAAKLALTDLVYQEGHVARSNMGWAYFHMKKLDQALSQLTQALLMEGKFCVARYRLGRVYLEQDRTEEAIAEFEKTLRQGHPCNSIQEVHLYLGLSYVKVGRTQEAAGMFETCLQVTPNSCVAVECRQYLKMLQQEDPENPED
jgi:tetratricopeptide (TPR) repeat protein